MNSTLVLWTEGIIFAVSITVLLVPNKRFFSIKYPLTAIGLFIIIKISDFPHIDIAETIIIILLVIWLTIAKIRFDKDLTQKILEG